MLGKPAEPEWWKACYDDLRQKTGFGNLSEERTRGDIDAVERLLDLHPPAQVLDLFCGTGRHCLELSKRGYEVTGLDYSREYVELLTPIDDHLGVRRQPVPHLSGLLKRQGKFLAMTCA